MYTNLFEHTFEMDNYIVYTDLIAETVQNNSSTPTNKRA